MIEKIIPRDKKEWLELRLECITSTEVSALFGLSPYMTAFELFHRKRDKVIVNIDVNDRMRWGSRLESAIAKGIAEDKGWQIRPMKEFVIDRETKMGSSFDYAIITNEGYTIEKTSSVGMGNTIKANQAYDIAILEIKNVDSLAFKNGWEYDGENLTAPNHIELQVQHQLALTGLPRAFIGALVGGNDVKIIERLPAPTVINKIRAQIKHFWKTIEEDEAPHPDFDRDSGFISEMYQFAEPGKIIDADDRVRTLAETYKHFGDLEKQAKGQREAAKAEILSLIKDAEKVKSATFTISAGVTGPSTYTVNREAFRNFKISWRKSA